MPKESIQFEHSPALIILCLIISAAIAYILYHKSDQWSRQLQITLFTLRFTLLFFITFLLIGPVLKQSLNTYEKPTIIIGFDNSQSMKMGVDSSEINVLKTNINLLEQKLTAEGYLIDKKSLNYQNLTLNETEFNEVFTDINGFLNKIETDYERRNLTGVILYSDGIYNKGISPNYKSHTFPIYCVGVGDTIPRKDIFINSVQHNKISYQGNKFPVEVEVGNNGFDGEEVNVSVSNRGTTIESQTIKLNSSDNVTKVVFLVDAKNMGLQRYSVIVGNKTNETNTANNRAEIYIDIVEGKERILIASSSPHPDIGAIKSAIEQNANYEVVTYISGIHEMPVGKFDLVIYTQISDRHSSINTLFDNFDKQNVPYWIIIGQNARMDLLNQMVPFVNVRSLGGDEDQISAVYNTAFTKFDFTDEVKTMLNNAPPLKVPFVRITTSALPLLYQRLGNVETKNPLLLINDSDNNKAALMLGDGLWKWKLYEYSQARHNRGFNELVLKIVQYLSSKQDKRRFKITPYKKEINSSESMVLEAEIYNDLYEKVYGQNITIELTDENNAVTNYNFINSASNSRYRISGLNKGVYKFKGTTLIDNKLETSTGEFFVNDLQLESLNLTANFELLRTISEQSGGKFYSKESNEQLINQLKNESKAAIIHTEDAYIPMINMKWVFFLLLLLVTNEWFIRKYNGQY